MHQLKYEVFTNVRHGDLSSIAELQSWLQDNVGKAWINWETFTSFYSNWPPIPIKVVRVGTNEHATLIKMRWT